MKFREFQVSVVLHDKPPITSRFWSEYLSKDSLDSRDNSRWKFLRKQHTLHRL